MKIFVTGISGFVGGSVANYFASMGYEVTGMGRKSFLPSHISKACKYIQADICMSLHEIEADVVIHAAGLASDTASFKELYSVNVQGTRNVLDAAKKAEHLIHISSSSVYHFNEQAMKEMEAGLHYKKLSDYGKSKFLAEEHILNNRNETKKTILRPRAIYGKYDQSLLPRLMKLVKGNNLLLPENLSKQISLTHIDNLIQAIELCVENQKVALKMFNVADNEVYNLRQILTTLLPLVASRPLQTVTIPAWVFDLLVVFNNWTGLNRSFNRFAVASLTKTAMVNTDRIRHQMNYNPLKNFYNSYTEISDWIRQEEGWKHFNQSLPVNTVL